jgi:hypothetical protein
VGVDVRVHGLVIRHPSGSIVIVAVIGPET